ncbi:MAG: peptidoglycan-binding domain-containing protein [Candidatus Pacebacteria bacterium]|nr:peptidoglycan-binding domain-containing protein [Candidatus Paceibacterota bacterium]
MINQKQKYSVYIIFFIIFLFPFFVSASTTNGTIDPTHNLAWGENLAWINFTANNDVTVTDAGLTGNIWSQTYGWINLNPNMGGVVNDGSGNLSGYAWGQNVGWINFSGAEINSSGKFTGIIGDADTTAGRISFDCANCDVETDWRPMSLRSPQGSGGGQLTYVPPTTTPAMVIPAIIPTTPLLPTVAPTTPPPANLSGCDNRTTGFSTTTGESCVNNITTISTNLTQTPSSQTTKFKFTKLLKLGSRGNEVKELQKFLNLKQDSQFGAITLKAVEVFQVKHKIAKPGIAGYGQVGPKTREVLNQQN